jgi:hypothetical protein
MMLMGAIGVHEFMTLDGVFGVLYLSDTRDTPGRD